MKYIIQKAGVFSNKAGDIPVGEEVEIENGVLAAKWIDQGIITLKKAKSQTKAKPKAKVEPVKEDEPVKDEEPVKEAEE